MTLSSWLFWTLLPQGASVFHKHILFVLEYHHLISGVRKLELFRDFTEKELTDRFPFVEVGGEGKPRKCKSPQKVAIIIPYRNRAHHLKLLLNRLHPMLYKQSLHYRIFVIEQVSRCTSLVAIIILEISVLGYYRIFVIEQVIIILYRNRAQHLKLLLNMLHPMLYKQSLY